MGNFFGGYTASAYRSILVLLILVPIAMAYRRLSRVYWRRDLLYLLGLVAGSLLIWGPFYYAILNAGVGVSLAVNYAGIVVGMFVFGRLLAGERFTKDKWLSAGLSLIGLWLVFSPSMTGARWIPLGAALIAGLSTASNMVLTKKIPYNATQSTVLLWTASVIANVLMALLLREQQPVFGLHIQWFYLLLFAVSSVVASWLFVTGTKSIDAGAAGILGLLEIVFGVAFGVIFFAERPTVVVLLGMVVIIAAASIPYIRSYNAKHDIAANLTT
jgi:drug/metabolite transporter (DMT)-like permease